jgi:RNA polymerase sigma factor (TIGR02999 family)
VSQSSSNLVTELLVKWRAGDQEALQELVPLVYNELRRIAHRYMRNEHQGHTLQGTALVHEAYLHLQAQVPKFENRAHFLAISAQLMRQILVQYARKKITKKRKGYRLSLDEAIEWAGSKSIDLVVLDDALKGLAALDEQQSRIVELRFFGGLSIEDTARALGVSVATVKRDWATARAYLRHEMNNASKNP